MKNTPDMTGHELIISYKHFILIEYIKKTHVQNP